jgi:hypothetical protein
LWKFHRRKIIFGAIVWARKWKINRVKQFVWVGVVEKIEYFRFSKVHKLLRI